MAKNQTKRTEEKEDDRAWREGVCPYYQRDRGHGHIYCEGTVFRFPDIRARREFVYAYCAHPAGFGQCPLKQVMDHYYERKFDRPEGRVPAEPCPPAAAPEEAQTTHRKHRKRGRPPKVKINPTGGERT